MSEVQVAELAQIADGDHRIFKIGVLEVGVFRQGEKVIAWENRCPHAGGPVCQGKVYQKVEEVLGANRTSQGLRFTQTRQIVCPWHGFEFDLVTGRHPGDPKMRLRAVEASVRDGKVYVRAPD
jgi:nitrite reductase/ring-hydroxylating ferredoxin subunit